MAMSPRLLRLLCVQLLLTGASPASTQRCDALEQALPQQPAAAQLLELGACNRDVAEALLEEAERSLRRAHELDRAAGASLVLGHSPQYIRATAADAVQPPLKRWAEGWSMAHSTAQRAQFFARGADDLLVESLLADLRMFSGATDMASRTDDVERFVQDLTYWFSVPAFAPPAAMLGPFFPFHPLISNLVSLTSIRTTDAVVAGLVRPCDMEALPSAPAVGAGCAALEKAMILYSARNTVRLDPAALFRHNPGFASLWYTAYYWLGYGGLANPQAFANMKRHMQASDLPPKLYMEASSNFGLDCLLNVYYMCTYVDPLRERHTRQLVNSWANSAKGVAGIIRGQAPAQAPALLARGPGARPPRILVIDAFWVHSYSSHRVVYRMIDKLQQAYHVDLLRASTNPVSMLEGFKTVYEMPRRNEDGSVLFRETIEWVVNQGYDAVMYPSISMDRVTLWLSQFRLSPIQVASYGQPVSTHGSRIDYWLAGEAVGPNHHMDFSERLLLLPDMAILHTYPTHYDLDGVPPQSVAAVSVPPDWFCQGNEQEQEKVGGTAEERGAGGRRLIINTQAAVHKTNAEWVAMLVRIVKQAAPIPITIRFFPNLRAHDAATSAAFSSELKAAFNGTQAEVEILCPPGSRDFIALLADGDIYLDSYPFGGCSSIIDALIINQPIVSLSGTKYSNRCGPYLLETAGLHAATVTSEREYFRAAVRVITDGTFRAEQTALMVAKDWGKLFFDRASPRELDYVAAFKYLFDQHDSLAADGSNAPFRVPELCASGAYNRPCE